MKSPASPRKTLTRRDFNFNALTLVGGSSLVLSLAGCGGLFSGGGSSVPLASLTGLLGLPGGVTLANLQVVGSGGFGTVTSSSFAVQMQSHIPSLATVWDSVNHKVLLMGILDPAKGDNSLDAESTATAVMFLGLGGMEYGPTDRRALLEAIGSSSQVTTLTTALQSALASDPFAITTAPPALKTAIKNAVDGFSSGATFTKSATSHSRSKGESQSTQSLTSVAIIEPTSEVDGLTFVQSSEPLGFKVQNTRRRFGRVLTYVTGHVDANDVETPENPPTASGEILDVPMTVGLLNTSGTGWSQVTSEVKTLSIVGKDKKTKYEMIALTPVFGAAQPAIYSDPRYAGEVAKWKEESGNLRQSVMMGGLMEIVLEILGLGGAAMSYTTLQSSIAGLLTTTQAIRTGMSAAYLGNIFYGQVIGELASKMTFEEIFYAELPLLETLTLKLKGDIAANTVRNAFLRPRLVAARAALMVIVALGIIELADIFAIAKDTSTGQEANVWTGLVFQPTVSLTASSNTYTAGGQVTFNAHLPSTGADIVYHWKAFGSNLMVLDDGVVFDKLEFDSTKNKTTLSTTPSTVGDLTVQVEAFDVSNGGRVSLGKASKVLELDSGNHNFSTDVVSVTKAFPSGIVVSFKYIVIGIDVDETGANGLKVSHPTNLVWTFKGSALTGVTGALDIYHPQIDINGDLQLVGTYGYFRAEQQGGYLVRTGPGKAYLSGRWTPVNWRVQGNSQAEVDAQWAALQTEIDALVASLKTNIQVQSMPGY